jgi:hypothetical protein
VQHAARGLDFVGRQRPLEQRLRAGGDEQRAGLLQARLQGQQAVARDIRGVPTPPAGFLLGREKRNALRVAGGQSKQIAMEEIESLGAVAQPE